MPANGDYPTRLQHLGEMIERLGQALPAQMEGFEALHEACAADGAIDAKTKELIALAIAITVRCDGCIAYHVHDAREAGASDGEMAEAIGVAVLMGGGPSVVYGAQALEAIRQFGAVAA